MRSWKWPLLSNVYTLTPPSWAPCSRLPVALMMAAPSLLFCRTQKPLFDRCSAEGWRLACRLETLRALVQHRRHGIVERGRHRAENERGDYIDPIGLNIPRDGPMPSPRLRR